MCKWCQLKLFSYCRSIQHFHWDVLRMHLAWPCCIFEQQLLYTCIVNPGANTQYLCNPYPPTNPHTIFRYIEAAHCLKTTTREGSLFELNWVVGVILVVSIVWRRKRHYEMVQNLNVFYSYISCAGYNVILWLLIELQEEGQIILIKCTVHRARKHLSNLGWAGPSSYYVYQAISKFKSANMCACIADIFHTYWCV